MIDWKNQDRTTKTRSLGNWFYRKYESGLTQYGYNPHLENRNRGDKVFIVERSKVDPKTLGAEDREKAALYGGKWHVVERVVDVDDLFGTPVSGPYDRARDARAALLLMIK